MSEPKLRPSTSRGRKRKRDGRLWWASGEVQSVSKAELLAMSEKEHKALYNTPVEDCARCRFQMMQPIWTADGGQLVLLIYSEWS